MFNLTFISQKDFEKHVSLTLKSYNESLLSINLKTFNSNIIDPIKLLFDKSVYRKSFEDVISMELQRQRDKTNTNSIGYFHQNIFQYIQNCYVPKTGWDVIFYDYKNNRKIFVEMKNKHNTMNSASSQKTYARMQNALLESPHNLCYLVEAIAPKSRDIQWICSLDGMSLSNERIRRVSIDKFYSITTGEKTAFFKLCCQLPITINKLISENKINSLQEDTVLTELKEINPNILKALYILAFKTYEGFNELTF